MHFLYYWDSVTLIILVQLQLNEHSLWDKIWKLNEHFLSNGGSMCIERPHEVAVYITMTYKAQGTKEKYGR
jgi:hypothetical protein